jgi:hypothetical protein
MNRHSTNKYPCPFINRDESCYNNDTTCPYSHINKDVLCKDGKFCNEIYCPFLHYPKGQSQVIKTSQKLTALYFPSKQLTALHFPSKLK